MYANDSWENGSNKLHIATLQQFMKKSFEIFKGVRNDALIEPELKSAFVKTCKSI